MRVGYGARVGYGLSVGIDYGRYKSLDGSGIGTSVTAGTIVLVRCLAGTAVGTSSVGGSLSGVRTIVGAGVSRSVVSGRILLPILITGAGVGRSVLGGQVYRVFDLSAAGVAASVASGSLVLVRLLSSAGLGSSVTSAALVAVLRLSASGVGSSLGSGTIIDAEIVLRDIRFFLDTSRGVVPTIGGLPTFARASSAESEDPNGRAITALPHTPQFTWDLLDTGHLKRPVLRMQAAHTTDDDETQAADLLYYADAPDPGSDAYYLRVRIDWDPDSDSGHLLWISDLTAAAPRIRMRQSGAKFYAQLHNGDASAEVEVEAAHETGQILELLMIPVEDGSLELLVALDGEIAGTASAGMPAGGFPTAWSDDRIVLNGYNVATHAAGYAEVKIIDQAGYGTGIVGNARMAATRAVRLSPAGEVV